jgi:hypothetical protein
MPDWKRRLLGLGLPCLLAVSYDVGLTLHGQPARYWAGDYNSTTEGAPFFRKLFETHPLAVVAGEALWASIILTWILLLPEVLAVTLAIAVVIGHTVGGYTWLSLMPMRHWFQIGHGTLLVAAAVLGVGLHWSLRTARSAGPAAPTKRLHPLVRWGLIVVATGLACYMYLIPQ